MKSISLLFYVVDVDSIHHSGSLLRPMQGYHPTGTSKRLVGRYPLLEGRYVAAGVTTASGVRDTIVESQTELSALVSPGKVDHESEWMF